MKTMTLIETWEVRAEEIRAIGDGESAAEAYRIETCITELESASTPRPPKPEWFEKWDSWWVEKLDARCRVREIYHARPDGTRDPEGAHIWVTTSRGAWRLDLVGMCIPVRREGPPAMDVGWGVLEGCTDESA